MSTERLILKYSQGFHYFFSLPLYHLSSLPLPCCNYQSVLCVCESWGFNYNGSSLETTQVPSTGDQVNKLCPICTMNYYSTIKKNEPLTHVTTWTSKIWHWTKDTSCGRVHITWLHVHKVQRQANESITIETGTAAVSGSVGYGQEGTGLRRHKGASGLVEMLSIWLWVMGLHRYVHVSELKLYTEDLCILFTWSIPQLENNFISYFYNLAARKRLFQSSSPVSLIFFSFWLRSLLPNHTQSSYLLMTGEIVRPLAPDSYFTCNIMALGISFLNRCRMRSSWSPQAGTLVTMRDLTPWQWRRKRKSTTCNSRVWAEKSWNKLRRCCTFPSQRASHFTIGFVRKVKLYAVYATLNARNGGKHINILQRTV